MWRVTFHRGPHCGYYDNGRNTHETVGPPKGFEGKQLAKAFAEYMKARFAEYEGLPCDPDVVWEAAKTDALTTFIGGSLPEPTGFEYGLCRILPFPPVIKESILRKAAPEPPDKYKSSEYPRPNLLRLSYKMVSSSRESTRR
jgi:hypothetical protein